MAARVDGLFSGWTSIRTPREHRVAASLLVTVPVTLANAIATFHASGRHVEAAMLADQRRDIESDVTLRLGELTGMMPYAVNRVRALETFGASETYRYWMHRILAVIFHAVNVTVGTTNHDDTILPGVHTKLLTLNFEELKEAAKSSAWLWYFPYAAGLVALTGRTIGMIVLDLRVVRLDHGRVGIAQSIWRYFLALCPTLIVVPVLLGLVRRMQSHDRLSKTRLIGGRTGLS